MPYRMKTKRSLTQQGPNRAPNKLQVYPLQDKRLKPESAKTHARSVNDLDNDPKPENNAGNLLLVSIAGRARRKILRLSFYVLFNILPYMFQPHNHLSIHPRTGSVPSMMWKKKKKKRSKDVCVCIRASDRISSLRITFLSVYLLESIPKFIAHKTLPDFWYFACF